MEDDVMRVDPFTFTWDELPVETGTFKEPKKNVEISLTLHKLDQPDVYAVVDTTGELESQYITGIHPNCKGDGPIPIAVGDRYIKVSTPLLQQCLFLQEMTDESSQTKWGWKRWAVASVTLPNLFKAASAFAQQLQRSTEEDDPNGSTEAVKSLSGTVSEV